MLAKWLAAQCRILILDEPTRGVDVGAKAEIHALIDELAAAGPRVLLISSELPEVLNLCTRIIVLREGRIAGELPRAAATQDALMRLMARRRGETLHNDVTKEYRRRKEVPTGRILVLPNSALSKRRFTASYPLTANHYLPQDLEGSIRRGDPAIDHLLKNDLLQIVLSKASLAHRGPGVHAELVESSERDERAEHKDPSRAFVEPGRVQISPQA